MIDTSRFLTIAVLIVCAGVSAVRAQSLDYLDLTDSTLAVVRHMPVEELEVELDAISALLSSYERAKRDADHHRQLILKALDDIKQEIDIIKTKSELAKKEERFEDRDSLEADKERLEKKKDYYELAAETRDYERRHADALVEWTKNMRTYFEKGVQLMEERSRGGRTSDLLTLEKELINEQKAAAKGLQKVGDEMARVAKRRENLYEEREALLKSQE